MEKFFEDARMQNHPLRQLQEFLSNENSSEIAKQYDKMRFVGYVLELSYDTATIITSDPFKIAVGGIPRNSMLIMIPSQSEDLPPHFTLLRVLESAPTPLTREVQQTYFELQKRSMPELDIFTQSELQWGALKTSILGMYYPHPEKNNELEFSGDINNFVSAHKYKVYSPDLALLNLIINSLVPETNKFAIGQLRLTECRLGIASQEQWKVDVNVSTEDFKGTRTAMFGKTRLGKSNVVKLIAQSLIETTREINNVGQLIFDINGEYANDNPQNLALKTAYPNRCIVYALSQENKATESFPLKLNFYEQPENSLRILAGLIEQDGKAGSTYIRSFLSVDIPSIDDVKNLTDFGEKNRSIRRIQLFWAILKKAGYEVNEGRLRSLLKSNSFDPGFSEKIRKQVYEGTLPPSPNTLSELEKEFDELSKYQKANSPLQTESNKDLFDSDDMAMLEFFSPQSGRSGTTILHPYRMYHSDKAGDFVSDILKYLDKGQTVILDLGNAHPRLLEYFSDLLSRAVFRHQVTKFSNNNLNNHYMQLYFEEAHNLFPRNDDVTTIYSRFAKEGAKYHIGMVYSTQSPSTVNRDLLAQTENFFIAHLASQDDVNVLAKINIAYESMKDDILRAKTPGYIRMLTRSHRFVVSMQAKKFEAIKHPQNGVNNAVS